MSGLRPASRSRRVDVDPVLAALAAAAVPPPVLVESIDGGPDLRAIGDAVRDLPEVIAAHKWTRLPSDPAERRGRTDLVIRHTARLNRLLYAASADALDPVPF